MLGNVLRDAEKSAPLEAQTKASRWGTPKLRVVFSLERFAWNAAEALLFT